MTTMTGRAAPGAAASVQGGHVARVRLEYLSDADKQFFHEQVVRILEEVGVAYNTPTLTALLAEAGAVVDARASDGEAALGARRALPGAGAERDPARGTRPGLRLPRRRRTRCSTVTDGDRHLHARRPHRRAPRGHAGRPAAHVDPLRRAPRDRLRVADRHARRRRPAGGQPLERPHHAGPRAQARLQDEVRTPDQAPVFIEMLEAIAGAPLRERPDLLGDQLHHRPAAARLRR